MMHCAVKYGRYRSAQVGYDTILLFAPYGVVCFAVKTVLLLCLLVHQKRRMLQKQNVASSGRFNIVTYSI